MNDQQRFYMGLANALNKSSIKALTKLRVEYAGNRSRVAAIDAKIAALSDVRLDPDAHPWGDDE